MDVHRGEVAVGVGDRRRPVDFARVDRGEAALEDRGSLDITDVNSSVLIGDVETAVDRSHDYRGE